MNLKLTPGRLLAAAVVAFSVWVVHGFIEALLAACVTALASWPLYAAFKARLPRGVGKSAGAAIFTAAMTLFVLAPMVFAGWALLNEARALLQDLAAADGSGALLVLTKHADPAVLLGWAQLLGQFTARHALIVSFSILLLAFLYQEGASLGHELTRGLRQAIGGGADRYVEVATRAVRASVNSMLVVGLFDALATSVAYGIAGVPHALLWAAITGSLAAVPFLGYGAVAAMALQLAMKGDSATALWSLHLGFAVLICGDKLVRPIVARGGLRLPFVWVLMGCIGGFSVLGLAGLVLGPVALTLARELWAQRMHEGGS